MGVNRSPISVVRRPPHKRPGFLVTVALTINDWFCLFSSFPVPLNVLCLIRGSGGEKGI